MLCCIFSTLVVAICGVQLTSYAHRPETETFSMVPMAQVEPQVLRVTTQCSVKWGCTPGATKNGSNWTWSGLVRIEQTGDCDDEHSEEAGRGRALLEHGNHTMDVHVMATPNMAFFDGNLTLCPGGALTVVVPEFAVSEESCSYGNFSCQPVLRVSVRGDPLSLFGKLEFTTNSAGYFRLGRAALSTLREWYACRSREGSDAPLPRGVLEALSFFHSVLPRLPPRRPR